MMIKKLIGFDIICYVTGMVCGAITRNWFAVLGFACATVYAFLLFKVLKNSLLTK